MKIFPYFIKTSMHQKHFKSACYWHFTLCTWTASNFLRICSLLFDILTLIFLWTSYGDEAVDDNYLDHSKWNVTILHVFQYSTPQVFISFKKFSKISVSPFRSLKKYYHFRARRLKYWIDVHVTHNTINSKLDILWI